MTSKFMTLWKTNDRYITLIKAVLMGLLPILCCLVYCAIHGSSIGDVYLLNCEWNDELFYFKQVEGIVNYGYPQGYFGFNESHALKLSFAAWSPVLVFPWIIWGFIFGWTLMSPIICNIVLLTLAMILFVVLVKPSFKQMGLLTLMFVLYTQFVRYMLSGMPEIICFSMLIVFYSLAVNYMRKEKNYKLVILFIMASVMTLMRPYLIVFFFLPMYLWIKKSKWKGFFGSMLILGVTAVCYVLIKHYLGAEYFAPLFFTEWITTFFTDGFIAGLRNFFGTLYYMGRAFWGFMVQGVRTGLAAGAFFDGYVVMMIIFLLQSVVDFLKVKGNRADHDRADISGAKGDSVDVDNANADNKYLKIQLTVELHLLFSFVAMFFALLLMYKLTEGSKHLLTFMAAGIFMLSIIKTKFYRKVIIVAACFAFLYSYKAVDPYDYLVPFGTDELRESAAYWEKTFDENLVLNMEDVPNFDNVVIWTFNDYVDGKSVTTSWQYLYELPEGFGVSCCMPDYVKENLENLKSKYLAVVAGGEIDAMCSEAAYREIGRDEDLVVYMRY